MVKKRRRYGGKRKCGGAGCKYVMGVLDRRHAKFIRENFASVVFCGGTVCRDCDGYSVGTGVSDKLFCFASVGRVLRITFDFCISKAENGICSDIDDSGDDIGVF